MSKKLSLTKFALLKIG